jgi:hypothetical protein
LIRVIEDYKNASAQRINLDKLEFFFSQSMQTYLQNQLQREMGVKSVERHEKHLGLPYMLGR